MAQSSQVAGSMHDTKGDGVARVCQFIVDSDLICWKKVFQPCFPAICGRSAMFGAYESLRKRLRHHALNQSPERAAKQRAASCAGPPPAFKASSLDSAAQHIHLRDVDKLDQCRSQPD